MCPLQNSAFSRRRCICAVHFRPLGQACAKVEHPAPVHAHSHRCVKVKPFHPPVMSRTAATDGSWILVEGAPWYHCLGFIDFAGLTLAIGKQEKRERGERREFAHIDYSCVSFFSGSWRSACNQRTTAYKGTGKAGTARKGSAAQRR